MTIQEAIRASVDESRMIRRKSFYPGSFVKITAIIVRLEYYFNEHIFKPYSPSVDDVLGDDWEVVEPEQ